MSFLGYSTPTLVGWASSSDGPVSTVKQVLQYLETLPAGNRRDLVFVTSADDVQLQLPMSTLVERFYKNRGEAQERLRERIGRRLVRERPLVEGVMFGAGKRCWPNQPHTIACYPLPESPLPKDLYGVNTDTGIGRNAWWSFRQRYLSSGFVIGTADAMETIYREARRLIQEHPGLDPEDDGSRSSDNMYYDSEQSIFAAMYGRQEWAREKLRRTAGGFFGRARAGSIDGIRTKDVLEPATSHELFRPNTSSSGWWKAFEYGMFLDHWSDIGHQTRDSEEDGRWISQSGPLLEQIGGRHRFDCAIRWPKTLPADIVNATSTIQDVTLEGWTDRSLYRHLCTGRVPVLIQMNGVYSRHEEHWANVWYRRRAGAMLEDLARARHEKVPAVDFSEHQGNPEREAPIGAWTDGGEFLPWDALCGGSYSVEAVG